MTATLVTALDSHSADNDTERNEPGGTGASREARHTSCTHPHLSLPLIFTLLQRDFQLHYVLLQLRNGIRCLDEKTKDKTWIVFFGASRSVSRVPEKIAFHTSTQLVPVRVHWVFSCLSSTLGLFHRCRKIRGSIIYF